MAHGTTILVATKYLAKKYNIKHIHISSYNSHANGIVKQLHFDIRQALFKAANGDQSKWSEVAPYVFWADCVTVQQCMGCSPYFALMGTHPLLPFNIAKASYLLPPPYSVLSMTDLIANWAITLQKCHKDLASLHSCIYKAQVKAVARFEEENTNKIYNFDFKLGDLILVHNTVIEKSLNRKMCPHYQGPFIVVSCNQGGAYIMAKLDGSLQSTNRSIQGHPILHLMKHSIATTRQASWCILSLSYRNGGLDCRRPWRQCWQSTRWQSWS